MKISKILVIVLIIAFSGLGFSCSSGTPDVNDMSMISYENGNYILENSDVRMVVDGTYGCIVSYKNLQADRELIVDSYGMPFSIDYGYDCRSSSIGMNSNNKVSSAATYGSDDGEVLKIVYNDLKLDGSGKSTGIKSVVYFTIGEDRNYCLISCDFDLTATPKTNDDTENGIYALKFFNGEFTGAGDYCRLTAPLWNGGQYWKNPWDNTNFNGAGGVTMGYPGINNESLEAGWLDLSGDRGGVGIALIDKLEIATEFRVFGHAESDSLTMTNVQFDPQQIISESVPLLAGETFSSDKLMLIAHDGDWHDTADAYRTEYRKAFVKEDGSADYLTYETMSNRVKNLDYITRDIAMIYGGSTVTFDKMYDNTLSIMSSIGGNYENHAFWLAGQNTQGYAYDVPFMTPTYAPSGGDEGLSKLASSLQALGSSIFVYEHPFAVDPEREEIKRILSSVDPGQHTEYWDGCNHRSVCIDNEIMYNMWKDEILPAQVALGVNGWQFDQCPLQQTVCDMEGHNHTDSAVSRLSSHAKGVIKLQKLVRSMVDDAYICSEARNDILCRYVDFSQQCWHHVRLWDGDWEYGAGQYTHPYVVYQPSSMGEFYDYDYDRYISNSNLMLQGALYGGIMCLSDGGAVEIKQEFVRFKSEMREYNAPGYPFGFRDDLGLTVSDEWLDARVFVEGNKLTVVYLSNYHVKDAKITVDLDRLGFTGKGKQEITVTQNMNKLGYTIIDTERL